MSWIVNVSGALAAPWMAGRNGLLNTGTPAGPGLGVRAALPPMCRPGHLRNDDASPDAPVVNYRVAPGR